jgi:hypothetical protein
LYDLAKSYTDIEAMLMETGGELTPEIEKVLATLKDAEEIKVEQMCQLYANFDGLAMAAKGEAQRLAALAGARFKAAENIKAYLRDFLEQLGKKKIVTPSFEVQRVRAAPVANVDPKVTPFPRFRKKPPPPPAWVLDKKAITNEFKERVEKLTAKLKADPDLYFKELKARKLKVSAEVLAAVMANEKLGEGVEVVENHYVKIK